MSKQPPIETVYLSRLVRAGKNTARPSKVRRPYAARLDPDVLETVVPLRIVEELGAKVWPGVPPVVPLWIDMAGRRPRLVVVRVSNAKAKGVGPEADILVGRDFLQELRGPSGARFSFSADTVEVQPITPEQEREFRDWFREKQRATDDVIVREVEAREFPRLIRTVRIAALGANGEIGAWHEYPALLDSAAFGTFVPRQVVKEVGTKRLRGPWPATVLLAVEMDGCPTYPVLAIVSDAKAREAQPEAEVIIGPEIASDWMHRLWQPLGQPLTPEKRRRILRQQWNEGWHEHIFSPYCMDEVHGRFDARLGESGFEVFDAGKWQTVAYARNGAEAVEIAQALAAEWRPARMPRKDRISTCPTCGKKALRAVTETVEFPIPGRPLKFKAVPHLKCSACGERLFGRESEAAIRKQRHEDSVDRAIAAGRRDYKRGDFIGPFSSAAEMHAALDKIEKKAIPRRGGGKKRGR